MANADAAFGFRPIGSDGGPYSGVTTRVTIPSGNGTPLFIGDAVKLDTATAATGGYVSVILAANTNPVYGVVTSFEADPTDLGVQYRKASTKRFAQVALANGTLFVAQDAAILGLAAIGANAAFTIATGSTVTGYSKTELGATATASTSDLQVMGGYDAPDNDMTLSNALFVIRFNDSQTRTRRVGV